MRESKRGKVKIWKRKRKRKKRRRCVVMRIGNEIGQREGHIYIHDFGKVFRQKKFEFAGMSPWLEQRDLMSVGNMRGSRLWSVEEF